MRGLVRRCFKKVAGLFRHREPEKKPDPPKLDKPRDIDWVAGAKPTLTPSSIHELNERNRKRKEKARRRKAGKVARDSRRRNRGR